MNTTRRDATWFNEGSLRALSGFYSRMLVTIAREMDEAPDAWVREAIGDWLDEFVREATSWRECSLPGAGNAEAAQNGPAPMPLEPVAAGSKPPAVSFAGASGRRAPS